MSQPDLNLLVTLHALLAEGSVAGAARRLQLSPSAMSRALGRLRETMGDPLLVRAGRGLVPTPRALALREQTGPLLENVQAVLRPASLPDMGSLVRTFTLRTREGFVETFGPALLARVAAEAPGVRLHFVPKADKDNAPLRDGAVDLETGVLGAVTGPEFRTQELFKDRFVGVVRRGHALASGPMKPARYAAGRHVEVSRRGSGQGPLERALEAAGLRREVAVVVDGFAAALSLAAGTDLIATVPERHTARLREGLHTFSLPFDVPALTISLLWHPRSQADPAHQWLRRCVREACSNPAP